MERDKALEFILKSGHRLRNKIIINKDLQFKTV